MGENHQRGGRCGEPEMAGQLKAADRHLTRRGPGAFGVWQLAQT